MPFVKVSLFHEIAPNFDILIKLKAFFYKIWKGKNNTYRSRVWNIFSILRNLLWLFGQLRVVKEQHTFSNL